MSPLLRIALASCGMGAAAAHAHVNLAVAEAPAGSLYKAVLRVGHGCDGSATHTLRITLPAGFRGAKPMPKPGWTLSIRRAALAEPYESHGKRFSDDVAEITWHAATREAWLPDAHYDEFVLQGQLPAGPGPLWFKVLQQCESGQTNWAETPASGTSTRGLKAPALLLQVQPGARAGHQH